MKSALALATVAVASGLKHEAASSCHHDKAVQALLQNKAESMGIVCEDMCKRVGVYPDCMCAGFNGQAADAGDSRSCIIQWCQDPKSPCPNDGFVQCVESNTKVSVLQWSKVFAQVDSGLDNLHSAFKMAKNTTKNTTK